MKASMKFSLLVTWKFVIFLEVPPLGEPLKKIPVVSTPFLKFVNKSDLAKVQFRN